MKFSDLDIQTQREAPNNARTEGFAFLVRASYLTREGTWLPLGLQAIQRLKTLAKESSSLLSALSIPVLESGSAVFFPLSTGSATILHCATCGYTEEAERAVFRKPAALPETPLPFEKVATPDCSTIDALAKYLGIATARTAKAMMFTRLSDEEFVFVVLRGDTTLSQRKLTDAIGEVRLATADEIVGAGAVPGYASPIWVEGGLLVVDELIPSSSNLVAGANEAGFHLLNTNYGRDYEAELVTDLARAHEGDPCANCGAPLSALNAELLERGGETEYENVLRAIVEIHHDQKGLTLPPHAAPFDVYLMNVPGKQLDTLAPAQEIYRMLEDAGIEVLFDDREARAGVKFNDADLIGLPLRVTVGEKDLANGMVELKARTAGETEIVPIDQLLPTIRLALAEPPAPLP